VNTKLFVLNFDTFRQKKYYSADLLKNQLAQEAEIAAMIALKQYFEDQKILITQLNSCLT
jgi:propionyl-CoA carboxylase alpha chain